MFDDIRSKKIVFIAHCLINQNAISDGTAVYPAAFTDLINLLMQNDIGIVQMPCPELCCLGLDRGNPSGAKSPVLIEKTLIGLVDKTITPQKQSEDGVCMANKLTKEETQIDWTKSAEDIHNLVRGIYKSPSAYFIYNGKIIKVLETKVIKEDGDCAKFMMVSKEGVEVGCGKDCILLVKVKPEGKGEMFARDWANGQQIFKKSK